MISVPENNLDQKQFYQEKKRYIRSAASVNSPFIVFVEVVVSSTINKLFLHRPFKKLPDARADDFDAL